MQIVLNSLLFCAIAFVGGFWFGKGFSLSTRKKKPKRPKVQPKPLTQEQQKTFGIITAIHKTQFNTLRERRKEQHRGYSLSSGKDMYRERFYFGLFCL